MFVRRLAALSIFALALYAFAAAAIVANGLHDHLAPADVAVVLGSRVYDDGRPSPSLAGRLDEAVVLYRRGLFPQVIVSGAVEPNGYDEPRVMRAYLIHRGVPARAIIPDPKGATTRLTAIDTAAIMKARGLRSVLLISQYFHMPRCRLAFAQAGVAPVYAAHARLFIWRDLYSIPREVAAYAVYGVPARRCSARRSGQKLPPHGQILPDRARST